MPCLKSGVAYRVCKSSVSSSRLPAIYLQYIVGIPPNSILGALCGRRSRHFEYSEYRCQFPEKKMATTNFSREYRCYICWYFDLDNQYHPYICCTFRKHSSCQLQLLIFPFDPRVKTAALDTSNGSLKQLLPHHYYSKWQSIYYLYCERLHLFLVSNGSFSIISSLSASTIFKSYLALVPQQFLNPILP